ncbi:tetratricopeptide repeat protein [Carboxylicivirga marina]|uniref:tetratricopeptide repeat protein n=1 Tax=Carboxylicivirga marina TaxID=2800988 RepID=UPI0025928CAF|nr:hypothetical protein [uncultured Carboxylicivirga sp.]
MYNIFKLIILLSLVSCSLKTTEKDLNYGTQKNITDEYGNQILQTYFNKEDFKNEIAYSLYCKSLRKSQNGNVISAISIMKEVLKIDAKNKMVLNDLGALYNQNKMLDSAKFYTQLSLEIDSTNVCALSNYGIYLYSENQDSLAIKYFDKAIKYDSTNSVSYMHKALAYHQLGQLDSCCRYLEIAKNCKSYDIENYLEELILKFCTNRNVESEMTVNELLESINENN